MKYIFLSLLVGAGLFLSCGDEDIFLEDPDSVVTENFFTNVTEFESALRGAYNVFKFTGYYGGSGTSSDITIVGDLLTDNLVLNPQGRQSNRLGHNWVFDASSLPTPLYSRAYQLISRANLILDRIDNLPDGEDKDRIRAEALAIRAIAHFDVARFWSQIPTQSAGANASLGIAYVAEFDPFLAPSRLETVAETYDLIEADLDMAIDLMPAGSNEVGRFDRNALLGFSTRIALYDGNYDKVIANGSPVIAAVAPAMANELNSLWTSASSPGVLFELPFIVSDALLDANFSQGTGPGMIAEYSVERTFFDLYDPATEPERFNEYFQINNNWIVVNKYIDGALQTGLNNGRYLRVEEVILNVAEAYYIDDNEPMALATLDILRNARYTSFTGGETGEALINAILLERRKELAFESSDRWFTLKRLQNVADVPAVHRDGVTRSGLGHFQDGTGVAPAELRLPAGDFRWQLPISRGTIIENPNIQQNPGYN